MCTKKRQQQRYDHRLRDLVRQTGDPDIVAHLSVPRSTAKSWLKDDNVAVVTDNILEMESCELQTEILNHTTSHDIVDFFVRVADTQLI